MIAKKINTISIPDQFESNTIDSYHGSYTDRIFLPPENGQTIIQQMSSKRRIVRLHTEKNGYFNDSKMPIGYKTTLRNLSVLFGNGFKLQKFWQRNINYNGVDTYLSSIGRDQSVSSSLVPQENILSPSQNLVVKYFCSQEQFADTILPSPPDIVKSNGGQFVEGEAEYIYPNSWKFPIPGFDFSSTTFGLSRKQRKFKLVLGGHGSKTIVTSSSDASQVSDNVWYTSYPFENKYKKLERFTNPSYNKKYEVSLTQSSHAFAGGITHYSSGGLDLKTFNSPDPCISNLYTIQWCFETIGTQRDTIPISPWHNQRRYINLVDVQVEVSGYSNQNNTSEVVLNLTGTLQLPNISEIYKAFYGVYHVNNPVKTPYFESIESPSGSNEQGGRWRFGPKINTTYNVMCPNNKGITIDSIYSQLIETNKLKGFRHHEDFNSTYVVDNRLRNTGKFPIHEYMGGFAGYGYYQSVDGTNLVDPGSSLGWFPTEDFNIHYLKLTGWKYGVYHALPSYTYCYYRRGKYGQFRDRLEQRLFTKTVQTVIQSNKKRNRINFQNISAAVSVKFLSGSTSYITASNQSLNITDSGIYDFEAKSGQPFSDSRV
jgi:hypothetical protein